MGTKRVEDWVWISSADLQHLAEEISAGRPKLAITRFWEPRVDVNEEEHRFVIKAELAGVRPEDITLLFVPERKAIVLRGVRPADTFDSDHVSTHQLEILYGEFSREISLPDAAVDARGIRAQYRNGFLIVLVPKLGRVGITQTCITVNRT
jgi:HSP20 family protein